MPANTGTTKSLWTQAAEPPQRESLRSSVRVDVCVVGAGISGLTTAYLLAQAGRSVLVIESGEIGGGETGRTTAHLSNALDDRYFELEKMHGEDGAKLAQESHAAAIDRIEAIASRENIDCDFTRLDGYLFNPPGDHSATLERELAAAHRAGLTGVEFVDRAPLPGFDTGRCLRYPNQAQFHPLKYLVGLARAVERLGGKIFTGTHAAQIEAGPPPVVTTDRNVTITAQSLVVATNTPVNDRVTMHTKQAAYRTYVVAFAIPRDSVPTALYWDTPDPYHYVRLQSGTDTDFLIVGGEDHKTGQHPESDPFARLTFWTRERFPSVGEIAYTWSGQVIEPVDGLAFIGRNPGDQNVYIATGDSGHGMTHGTIAGMLVADLIQNRPNPWQDLYDPARTTVRSASTFAKENLNVAAQYASLVTPGEIDSPADLLPNTGAVIRHGLSKAAVYKDAAGNVTELS
ncbi:MAG: dependent oxidoreductase, partial [Bryobacterales bacterium]|nr:dependent oxidoreductase [Bryobacterales bacterium]